MASSRDVKNPVGQGRDWRPRVKFATTRSTGFEPSKAIRDAAHGVEKTALAWRVTLWVFVISTNIG